MRPQIMDAGGRNRKADSYCRSSARRLAFAHIQRIFAARILSLALAAGILAVIVGCGGSSGSSAAYPERDIRFLVGTTPGGGFDTWARILAPHLEEKLPGEGAVVVENFTGAGGLRAANTLYTAQPDGYTIGITNTLGLAAAQVSGQAEFDLNEFTWIGRLVANRQALLVAADSEFQSVEDLQNADRDIKGAITSMGASTGIGAVLICDTFGIAWTPVTHEGGSEATLSVIRGDTDVTVNYLDTMRPELEAGEMRPILTTRSGVALQDIAESPAVSEAPTIDELGHPELDTALALAQDIAAPPDLPEEVRDTLSKAFVDTVNDPDFRREVEDADFSLDPLDSQETTASVAELLNIYNGYEEVLTEAASE